MTLIEELSALVRALDEDKVEYALVGGLAVAVWGIARATKDIDLLVERADAERAAAVAKGCGLIAMKLAAGRAQDLADVQKLRETDR